jgi:hypothetical protein
VVVTFDVLAGAVVVVVVDVTVPAAKGLLLLPEATIARPAATKPKPTIHHMVLSLKSCAFDTPAGFPGASGPTSVAARALEANSVAATVTATNFRIEMLPL